MPPVGLDRKEDDQVPSNLTTDAAITNKDDLEEIGKIRNILNPNEEVFVVARQSRLKPGGSKFTPNIIFATDRRIIIKDPSMLGLREQVVDFPYDMISSVKLEAAVITAIPKYKAANHWWSDRILSLSLNLVIHRT